MIAKLGERIQEMKSGIAEARISPDEVTEKLLTELQTKQTTPEVKLSKYYLFDVKRWLEWIVWGGDRCPSLHHRLGGTSLCCQSNS